MGGPTPLCLEPSFAAVSRSPKEGQLAAPDTQWVLAQRPMGTPWGENTLSRGSLGGIPPAISLRMFPPPRWPPKYSGSVTSHLVTDFYRLFGLSWENIDHYFRTTVISCDHCFFFR